MPTLGKENALRIARIALLSLFAVSLLVSCGGSPSDTEPAAGQEDSHGHDHDGGGDAVEIQTSQSGMPDPNDKPVEFLEWRVDQMFVKDDLDGDGLLTADEWSGPAENFARLDADDDGHLTKKEIVDDQTAAMREKGMIP